MLLTAVWLEKVKIYFQLFGAVSAYLIILIQFDMAQQISTVKEPPQST